jgi:hypothetical protein
MDPQPSVLEAARQFDWSLPARWRPPLSLPRCQRNLAIALGAKHSEAGTCKAIQAVLATSSRKPVVVHQQLGGVRTARDEARFNEVEEEADGY